MKLGDKSMPRPLTEALLLRPRTLDLGRRGFPPGAPAAQRVLNDVVHSFAVGYNGVLASQPAVRQTRDDPAHPEDQLPHAMRGFAIEGAAMSSVLLDLLTFSDGRRFRALHDANGGHYTHLIHVGAGWAFARLHRRPWGRVRPAQPMFGWLAWDGWGFHQAFFHSQRVYTRHWIERATPGEVRQIRDQGVGRALWFYAGADPARITEVIAGFPPARRSDLWAGIGLAAAYTGAQPSAVLARLVQSANGYRDHLAQGAAFAAKAHLLSGGVPEPAAAAVEVLTDAEFELAASWTDASLAAALRQPGGPGAYEHWRAGIRAAWARHRESARR